MDEGEALSGKALRRSFEHAWKKMGLHLVTAYCVEDSQVLCQSADFGELPSGLSLRVEDSRAVEEKSNEITAVPKLLDLLDVSGAVVAVDALNTRKTIAKQIIDGSGDYAMALKASGSATAREWTTTRTCTTALSAI
jgi:hypothetical protein